MSIKKWKKPTLILTATALLFGGAITGWYISKGQTGPNKIEWKSHKSCNERFDISFPGDPKETSEEMNVAGTTIQYNELKSEAEETTYAVSYIDFPSHWKWLGTKKLLTKSFDGFLEAQGDIDEVLNQEITNHHGIPALAYHIKQGGKEVKGKFIISGNTLYRLSLSYLPEKAPEMTPCPFFDSFQIKS